MPDPLDLDNMEQQQQPLAKNEKDADVTQKREPRCNARDHDDTSIALPLMQDAEGQEVHECLRHRLHDRMRRLWSDWAKKGNEPLSLVEAKEHVRERLTWCLGRWKAGTIKRHGSMDCLTAQDEQILLDLIAETAPTSRQIKRRTLATNEYRKRMGIVGSMGSVSSASKLAKNGTATTTIKRHRTASSGDTYSHDSSELAPSRKKLKMESKRALYPISQTHSASNEPEKKELSRRGFARTKSRNGPELGSHSQSLREMDSSYSSDEAEESYRRPAVRQGQGPELEDERAYEHEFEDEHDDTFASIDAQPGKTRRETISDTIGKPGPRAMTISSKNFALQQTSVSGFTPINGRPKSAGTGPSYAPWIPSDASTEARASKQDEATIASPSQTTTFQGSIDSEARYHLFIATFELVKAVGLVDAEKLLCQDRPDSTPTTGTAIDPKKCTQVCRSAIELIRAIGIKEAEKVLL